MNNKFLPFKNDSQSITVGPNEGLTVENGIDSISIYGQFEITKDVTKKEVQDMINILIEIQNNLKK